MTSALAELTRHGRARPTAARSRRSPAARHVRLSLAPGYYEWACVADLERQLTRLARLLFVARMKAYYVARSKDFEQLFTREPRADDAARRGVRPSPRRSSPSRVWPPAAPSGSVRSAWTPGRCTSTATSSRRMDEQAFCDAASEAATRLVECSSPQVRALKREIYGNQ